jgi:hypothetical protein
MLKLRDIEWIQNYMLNTYFKDHETYVVLIDESKDSITFGWVDGIKTLIHVKSKF